ncbi:MAG TPA: Uma2 family endonuclease [Mycobacteriales bacterium]|nr:Uma2 family endonuclease [Mycobacteriales bacterium]
MSAQLSLPDRQVWTIDDLLSMPDDGHRYEIFDGSLLVSPAPPKQHQAAADRLRDALQAAAPDGVEVITATAIDMTATSPTLGIQAPVPDIVVAAPGVWDDPGLYVLPSRVLLLVEVESPRTSRDRVLKPALYAAAGIPAYWRVELDPVAVVTYVLDGAVYREDGTVRAGESAVVGTPFPLELRPADLVGPLRRG